MIKLYILNPKIRTNLIYLIKICRKIIILSGWSFQHLSTLLRQAAAGATAAVGMAPPRTKKNAAAAAPARRPSGPHRAHGANDARAAACHAKPWVTREAWGFPPHLCRILVMCNKVWKLDIPLLPFLKYKWHKKKSRNPKFLCVFLEMIKSGMNLNISASSKTLRCCGLYERNLLRNWLDPNIMYNNIHLLIYTNHKYNHIYIYSVCMWYSQPIWKGRKVYTF